MNRVPQLDAAMVEATALVSLGLFLYRNIHEDAVRTFAATGVHCVLDRPNRRLHAYIRRSPVLVF